MNKLTYSSPLYKQIEHLIYEKILTQEYLPGQKIPSERQLALHYKISRTTAQHAITSLVDQGILTRKIGKGTFVASSMDQRFNISFKNSSSMTNSLSSQGINTTNKVIKFFTNINSDFLRQKLSLKKEEHIFGIQRIKLHNNNPFALENSYVPGYLFPDFYKIDFNNIGLYDYMESKGHMPLHNETYQLLQKPMPQEAKLLRISTNSFVFKSCYSSADEDGNLVEYTESYFNASKGMIQYRLELE